ncbi:MAG: TauD/TfdA family dioxygenase [Pseudomonadota bacterium]
MTDASALDIVPITPRIGAEVHGLDLAALSAPALAALREAFARHRVLVFRDQRLDREAHKQFGRLWGPLQTHPAKTELGLPGDPEIFKINIGAETRVANGESWHTDLSCEPVPPSASALYITQTPPSGGGDTMFANMTDAFTSLSDPIQQLLVGLTAVHSGEQDLRAYGVRLKPGQHYPQARHPVVISHPQSGDPVLYVNEAFTESIDGLSKRESDALLQLLFRHVEANTRIQCRVQWQPNTLVLWDNMGVHHHAVWDYYPECRRGERVTARCLEAPAPWAGPV